MMLSLDEILAMPHDPSEEHLRSMNLLPPKPVPASIIPPAKNIPTPSPVTAPAPTPPADWRARLAATVPHAGAPPSEPLPPLTPLMKSTVAGAPDVGAPGMGETPATSESATPGTSFPKLAPLNFKERQALPTTSEGVAPGSKESFEAQLARLQDQKANPWGSPENHPGLLGKIGHYAAKIGNIAGDVIAPATMANIPGTDLNRKLEERGLEKNIERVGKEEEEAKTGESERELRSAQAKRDIAEANRAEREKPEKEVNPEGQTFDDLTTGGPNGGPKLKPDGTPYTSLEAYEAVKQAGAKPKEKTPANTPATPEAIADYQERLKHVGLDAKSAGTFSSVPPGTTMAELEKRYTDAKSLREMGQKDRENAIHDREREDNERERVREHTETREDKLEKEGRTLVRVRDDKTGKTFVEPLAKAKADGLAAESMEEVPAGEKAPIQDARLVLKVINKKGDKPENKGVLQLVDELDKEGKLGVATSRLNSFLAGGVGTLPGDDPRIMALLDKADLAMTLSMKAHFGVSGGRSPQMLEHFLNLANAKKMSGPALRSGFKAVGDYMNDRAELPPSGGGGGGATGHNFSINGKEYTNVPDELYNKYKSKPGFKE